MKMTAHKIEVLKDEEENKIFFMPQPLKLKIGANIFLLKNQQDKDNIIVTTFLKCF